MSRRRFLRGALAVLLPALLGGGLADALAAPVKKPSRKKPTTKKKSASKPRRSPQPAANTAAEPEAAPASKPPPAEPPEAPWSDYAVRVALTPPSGQGPLRVWLPLPWPAQSTYQHLEDLRWAGSYRGARVWHDHDAGASAFIAEWPEGSPDPEITLDFGIRLRERRFDVTRRGAQPVPASTLRPFLRSSSRIPTDGAVAHTAERIVGRIREPVAQGKAIYDWIIDTLAYDAQGSGLGHTDVTAALTDRSLLLRSDDICRTFVALARAAGLPARRVVGLRAGRSQVLSVLDARHDPDHDLCARAEFFTPNYAWIPVDPADALLGLAQASRSLDSGRTALLKRLMFGFWDGHWIALSAADDLKLPNAVGPPPPHFAKPYAERDGIPRPGDWTWAIARGSG